MKRLTKTVVMLFVFAMGMVTFSGCHTAHGFGKDVEKTGEKIQQGTE